MEASTYEFIREVIPAHRILCHHPYQLLPETPQFSARDWRVDFTVCSPCGLKRVYIEAKGIRLLEFKHDLQLIAFLHPALMANMLIVHYELPLIFSKKCVSVSRLQMWKILKRLEDCEWEGIEAFSNTP